MPWRPVPQPTSEEDILLDRAMWHFWSEIQFRQQVPGVPELVPAPQEAIRRPIPPGERQAKRSATLPIRRPPWESASYFSVPFGDSGSACDLFYKTWVNVYVSQVQESHIVKIERISYEATGLPDNEVIEWEVLNNGTQIARWEDMKINGSDPNPAHHFVFGGHILPVPFVGIFDRVADITVRARILGPEDGFGNFPRKPTDQASCGLKVLLQGWTPAVASATDEVPKPFDMPTIQSPVDGCPILDEHVQRVARDILAMHGGYDGRRDD